MLTLNYRDINTENNEVGLETVKPFGSGFKPIILSLMIEDKDQKKPRLYLHLHPDEAAFFIKLLEFDRTQDTNNLKTNRIGDTDFRLELIKKKFELDARECRFALVNPEFGILHQGKDPIVLDPETDNDFLMYKVESKVWNGKLHYNKQEIIYLKEWIKRVGPTNFEKMFLEVIVRLKPKTSRQYAGSILEQSVNELKHT